MKILFVENHSVSAKQASMNFLADHQVTVVPSLSAARVNQMTGDYELVLVDYDLDDGKGAEPVRELRGNGRGIRVSRVSAREEGNAALLEAGADAVCSKMEFDRMRKLI